MASQSSPQSEGLERNAIGLTEVLFQSITFMSARMPGASWPRSESPKRSATLYSSCPRT